VRRSGGIGRVVVLVRAGQYGKSLVVFLTLPLSTLVNVLNVNQVKEQENSKNIDKQKH